MRIIDYITGFGRQLTLNDIRLWFDDDTKKAVYIFHAGNGGITPKQKMLLEQEVYDTVTYGRKSSLCRSIRFEKTKYFDFVVIYHNKKVHSFYPIKLREKLGVQIIYDLGLYYNKKTKEYNIDRNSESIFGSSKLNGNVKVLELFLNYGLGIIYYDKLYNILKQDIEYTINGFKLQRENDMVKITIVNPILKETVEDVECKLSNESFDLLIDKWFLLVP